MNDPIVQLQAGVVGLVVLLLVLLVRALLRRRALVRRLAAVAVRLEPAGAIGEFKGVEGVLAQLERAVQDRVAAHGEATDTAGRQGAALDHVREGVMVWDDGGRLVFANREAATFPGGPQGEPLAEQALSSLVQSALGGRRGEQTLDLFGPPRRT
ncbi:MAG: hypothetical protein M3394_01165, partial [Actinomycetota bacterium]|nr:hypothetical protein [Actinomycetota bacterium]